MILNMPWTERSTPAAALDVIRGCNARCAFCYKRSDPYRKSLVEIGRELDELLARRDLQAVMITGGEPLLHPGVLDIVRAVRGRGLVPILFTNGILIDRKTAEDLAAAGCGPCFLHIQTGQARDDISDPSDEAECVSLLRRKCGVLAAAGLRAGCCLTLDAGKTGGVRRALDAVLSIPEITNVLFTVGRDVEDFDSDSVPDVPVEELVGRFRDCGLVPFAAQRGRLDPSRRRWFTFQIVEARNEDGSLRRRACLRGSLGEALAMRLDRLVRGRNVFTLPPPSNAALRARLVLNAVTGGRFVESMSLAVARNVRLVHRAIVLDTPPYRLSDGRIETCATCPAAQMKDGELKPLCVVEIESSGRRCT